MIPAASGDIATIRTPALLAIFVPATPTVPVSRQPNNTPDLFSCGIVLHHPKDDAFGILAVDQVADSWNGHFGHYDFAPVGLNLRGHLIHRVHGEGIHRQGLAFTL